MIVDTHCHLNIMTNKKPDALISSEDLQVINQLVHDASKAGVSDLICVGTSVAESENVMKIAAEHPRVHAVVGIHPCDVTAGWREDMQKIEEFLTDSRARVVGIGETGLDFYHMPFDAHQQKELFRSHIVLAMRYDLPLVIHIRDAGADALAVLEAYKGNIRGVIHCFSLDASAAARIISWGEWYIGIGGPVTYPKNEQLREAVLKTPLEHILLETDAPFLPPQSMRGKPNSPQHLHEVIAKIAQVKGMTVEEVARVTTHNAKKLFSLT